MVRTTKYSSIFFIQWPKVRRFYIYRTIRSRMEPKLVITEEAKAYNPWNPANRIITDGEILQILKTFGIHEKPKRWELFRQACVHSSYVDRQDTYTQLDPTIVAPRPDNCIPLCKCDNEQIEFVGDSLLGCIIALYLHERYPDQDEGFLTRLRTRLVNNKQLGDLALKIGFNQFIVLSKHVEETCGGRNNLRILGSMLEAWIGAMYLDISEENPGKAFIRVRTWIINLFEDRVDFVSLISEDNNFKDQILRYYQSTYHTPPRYKEVCFEGPLHDRTYTMGVLAPDGSIVATATARTKKVAEQEASRKALIKFGVIQEE